MQKLSRLIGNTYKIYNDYPNPITLLIAMIHIFSFTFALYISISFIINPIQLFSFGLVRGIIILIIGWVLSINYCKRYDTED